MRVCWDSTKLGVRVKHKAVRERERERVVVTLLTEKVEDNLRKVVNVRDRERDCRYN